MTCFPVEVPEDITDVYFLRLRLTGADGAVLSENFYAQGLEEGNLRALRSLPKAAVRVEKASRAVTDGEIVEVVRLTNTGKTPALMLRVKALDSATGDLVLPVWYSDNYVSLMPGESVELQVKVRREDLRGRLRLSVESCL